MKEYKFIWLGETIESFESRMNELAEKGFVFKTTIENKWDYYILMEKTERATIKERKHG